MRQHLLSFVKLLKWCKKQFFYTKKANTFLIQVSGTEIRAKRTREKLRRIYKKDPARIFFLLFLFFLCIHALTFIQYIHHPPRSFSISSSLVCSVGNTFLNGGPRFELGPAVEQAGALPTENWATPHPKTTPLKEVYWSQSFSLLLWNYFLTLK